MGIEADPSVALEGSTAAAATLSTSGQGPDEAAAPWAVSEDVLQQRIYFTPVMFSYVVSTGRLIYHGPGPDPSRAGAAGAC